MSATETALRTSACVDCATPIIGERPRCPACHDRHAVRLIAAQPDDAAQQDETADDAATAPRPRQRVIVANRAGLGLARWAVVFEIVGIVGLALVLLVKGCAS